MIDRILRKFYKWSSLYNGKKKIWNLEIQRLNHLDFFKEADEHKKEFEIRVKNLEDGLRKLELSGKYEDRMTRKDLEKDLAVWQNRLNQQNQQIDISLVLLEGGKIGDKTTPGIYKQIENIKRQMAVIKRDF